MSIEAMTWALRRVEIPEEVDPRQRPHLRFVLLCLADHADPDGRNAFPSNATLVRYTDMSESTVRRCLQTLEELGLIEEGNPAVAQAYIGRRDRIPKVYDLLMDGVSDGGPRGVIAPPRMTPKPPNKTTPQQEPSGRLLKGDGSSSVGGDTSPLRCDASKAVVKARTLETARELCEHLADQIEVNTDRRPTVSKEWVNAARLMMERDKIPPEHIRGAIDWATGNEFWRTNILCMRTLRRQYNRLVLQAKRERDQAATAARSTTDQRVAQAAALAEKYRAQERAEQTPEALPGLRLAIAGGGA